MSFSELFVREKSFSEIVRSRNCPFGKLSFGELSFRENSITVYAGHINILFSSKDHIYKECLQKIISLPTDFIVYSNFSKSCLSPNPLFGNNFGGFTEVFIRKKYFGNTI